MRISYVYPSGNYNIFLSKEDIDELLKNGRLHNHSGRIPCEITRMAYNPDENKMEVLAQQGCCNLLYIQPADTDGINKEYFNDEMYIQFLDIRLEKENEDD